MPEILIHLPRDMIDAVADNPNQFYRKLERGLSEAGYAARILRRRRGNPCPPPDDNFHFVHQGLHRQANVLNTGLAYVFPFWYADPTGIYGHSSLVSARFEPSALDRDAAQSFGNRLRARLVAKRFSRYDQKTAVTPFDGGHVAVFLQGPGDILERAQLFETVDLLRAVARLDRPVVVKPHPAGQTDQETALLHDLDRAGLVQQTDANIHDILSGAVASVSISSAVTLEGMMHGVPAVLCGLSDLHHNAVTARSPDQIGPAIEQAIATPWQHDAFLYWFLFQQNLNAGAPDLIDRALARIAATGADVTAFRR